MYEESKEEALPVKQILVTNVLRHVINSVEHLISASLTTLTCIFDQSFGDFLL
jgi:hypothetical protein